MKEDLRKYQNRTVATRWAEQTTQTTFIDETQSVAAVPIWCDAATQLGAEELCTYEEAAKPVVEDLVHDVISRAVFSLEQEQVIRRVSSAHKKYHDLRKEEEKKFEQAKYDYMRLHEEASVRQSALKKVLSIQMARELVQSLVWPLENQQETQGPSVEDERVVCVRDLVAAAHILAHAIAKVTVETNSHAIHTNTGVY